MKTVSVLLLAALSVTTLTGAAATGNLFQPPPSEANSCSVREPSPVAAEPAPRSQRVTLRISGMITDSCPVLVETAVGRMDGVVRVNASLAEKQAEVEYLPAETSPEAIIRVIRDQTGFQATVAR